MKHEEIKKSFWNDVQKCHLFNWQLVVPYLHDGSSESASGLGGFFKVCHIMVHINAHDIPPWQELKDTVLKSPGDPLSMDHWQARMWAPVFLPR